MKIKFLLSDLDGVIRLFPSERAPAIEQKYGLGPGSIFTCAFEKTLLTKAVCGQITDEVWRSEITKSLAEHCDEKIALEAIQEWSDFSGIVNQKYLDYVESKLPGIPVAILTNGTSRLNVDLAKLGLQNRFFKIFNSAEIGFCKPDRRIYQHVVNHLGCEASEIMFVDDSISHIQAANEIGMLSHHYNSLEDFQKFNLAKGFS